MATPGGSSEPPDFCPYEKMATSTNYWPSKRLNAVKKWVALEKIHGANFSFTVHALGPEIPPVLAAKRSGFLKPQENFFRLQKQPKLVEEEQEKARRLFVAVQEMHRDATAVTVFGELFGGCYPHPSVAAVAGLIPIQTEVLYCPGLKFIAYDVAVTNRENRVYLDYDVCMQLFKATGFLYAEPLLTGTLQDMLGLELGFETRLPAKFGLPPLQGRKNVAEGVVIKPLKTVVLDTSKGPQRVIFKRKVENFQERKPRGQSHRTRSRQKEFSQREADREVLRYEMSALVTNQRVVNTVSKQGIPEQEEEWEDLVEAVVADVLESVVAENEDLWQACVGEVEGLVGELREECQQAVEDYRLRHSPDDAGLSSGQ